MKLKLNPMPALRAQATAMVNAHFDGMAAGHREAAWRRKRDIATAVQAGSGASDAFSEEATLRGISVADLAGIVLSKSNPLDARELWRQKALMKIDRIATPSELEEFTHDISKV